jgi:hypothetical protein
MSVALTAEVTQARAGMRGFADRKLTPIQSIPDWSVEKFAREQIYSLVRQVFRNTDAHPVRQVVFTGIGTDVDVPDLCLRVAQMLAAQRLGDVALVGTNPVEMFGAGGNLPVRQIATRLDRNLWSLEGKQSRDRVLGRLYTYLSLIRKEFEYSIVAGLAESESDTALEASQSADGVVLVLSAKNTRRMTAVRVKRALETARVRVLGAVLMDREFLIPERLYRRL